MQTDEAGQEGQPIVYANLSIEDEALLLRQCRLNKVSRAERPISCLLAHQLTPPCLCALGVAFGTSAAAMLSGVGSLWRPTD